MAGVLIERTSSKGQTEREDDEKRHKEKVDI